MNFEAMKSLLDDLITEQENIRKENLKKLVKLKGPAEAMLVVQQIAQMFNPDFADYSVPAEYEHLTQANEEESSKEVRYGKVVWKD